MNFQLFSNSSSKELLLSYDLWVSELKKTYIVSEKDVRDLVPLPLDYYNKTFPNFNEVKGFSLACLASAMLGLECWKEYHFQLMRFLVGFNNKSSTEFTHLEELELLQNNENE
jgi:hypothetical protein